MKNFALEGTTDQSQTIAGEGGVASIAVDGIKDRSETSCTSVTVGTVGSSKWWSVDLNKQVAVNTVSFMNCFHVV